MNDVFISYSRPDAAWAQKLHDDLAHPARDLTVFLDTSAIQGGDEWEKQLAVNLKNCRNLVLLWSNTHTTGSKWVDREVSLFRNLMLLDEDDGLATNRRILQVCLDGRNAEYARWQAIENVNDPEQFKKGADHVDPNRWQTMLDRLTAGVHVDDKSPEVHQLILASTRQQMSRLTMDVTLVDRYELGPLLAKLGLSHPAYLDAYGADRSDWRPFGSGENIVTLLARLRCDLIAVGGPRFRWKPVERAFWEGTSADAAVSRVVTRLTREPSVIVVDPLSLYDSRVFGRYLRLMQEDYLSKPNTCLIVPPPCPTDTYWSVQEAIGKLTDEVYKRFYTPVFDDKRIPLASFSALASHPDDMQRLLAATLRQSRHDNPQWWGPVG